MKGVKKRPFEVAFEPSVVTGTKSNVVTKSVGKILAARKDKICGAVYNGKPCTQLASAAVLKRDTNVYECPNCSSFVAAQFVTHEFNITDSVGRHVPITDGVVTHVDSDDDADDHTTANGSAAGEGDEEDEEDADGKDMLLASDESTAITADEKKKKTKKNQKAHYEQFEIYQEALGLPPAVVQRAKKLWDELDGQKGFERVRDPKAMEITILELACLYNGTPLMKERFEQVSGVPRPSMNKCLKRIKTRIAVNYNLPNATFGFARLFISKWVGREHALIATQGEADECRLLRESKRWIDRYFGLVLPINQPKSSTVTAPMDGDVLMVAAGDGKDAKRQKAEDRVMSDVDEPDSKTTAGKKQDKGILTIAGACIIAATRMTGISQLGNRDISMAFVCSESQMDLCSKSLTTRYKTLQGAFKELPDYKRIQPRKSYTLFQPTFDMTDDDMYPM